LIESARGPCASSSLSLDPIHPTPIQYSIRLNILALLSSW
jgi:hypothetical protein